MKEYDLLLHDVKRRFGKMEQDTGTLWEYRIHKGSHDHGICAHVAAAIQTGLNGKENIEVEKDALQKKDIREIEC